MKISIRTKIILSTSIIIILAFTVSAAVVYSYFANILHRQIIQDEKVKLQQCAQQMQYNVDDISKLALNVIVDPEMQDFMKENNYESYFDKLNAKASMEKHLNEIMSTRNCIQDIIVISNAGEAYSTYANDDYYKNCQDEEWYVTFLKTNATMGFSVPHEVKLSNEKTKVISYFVKFNDIESPGQALGTVIINVKFDFFSEAVRIESEGSDGLFWVDEENRIFLKWEPAERDGNLNKVLDEDNEPSRDTSYTIIGNQGYYIVNQFMNNGWKLVSYISNGKIYNGIYEIFQFFLTVIIVSILLLVITVSVILFGFTRHIPRLSKAMKNVSSGNLQVKMEVKGRDEFHEIASAFNKMVVDLKKYFDDSMEYKNNIRKMEFELLLSQINPHFIYNTLNSVVYIARGQKNFQIVEMVNSFISILHDAVRIGDKGVFTSLRQELEVVKHYLLIQSYRYPDQFDVYFNIDEALYDAEVPKSILQPIVENALFHGVCPKEEKGRINIRVFEEYNNIVMIFEDDGIGMDEETLRRINNGDATRVYGDRIRHIGLANINNRIKYLYEDKCSMHIESRINAGTKITVVIPKESSMNKNLDS